MQQNAILQVRNYVNAYKCYNCLELITKPTWITPSSSTIIDHIYTTLPSDKVAPGILINDLSDHLPIFVLIKLAHVEKLNTKAQFKHDFSKYNAEEFMEETKEALNSMNINSDNPAAALDDAIGAIKKVLDECAPLKKMSRTQRRLNQKPWITSNLYKLIKTKNKLYRALVRCKFDDKQDYKRYKKMMNKVNHKLEISKRKHYQSQFNVCANKLSFSLFYE